MPHARICVSVGVVLGNIGVKIYMFSLLPATREDFSDSFLGGPHRPIAEGMTKVIWAPMKRYRHAASKQILYATVSPQIAL